MHQSLVHAKFAYTTRRVERRYLAGILPGSGHRPAAGDLVLARVDSVGQHSRLELADSRRATLFTGDEIVVCYGSRYAPDQFEAEVPSDLGPCDLVAAGGLAAELRSRHLRMDEPTRITPLGLLALRDGGRANLSAFALPRLTAALHRPQVAVVVGTSMNSGKTTTVAHLVRGLVASGHVVGAAKITGTGAGGDGWLMRDAGARVVLDFVDAGVPSTYRLTRTDVEEILVHLVGHLTAAGVEAAVLEIADGIYQQETAALLRSRALRATADAIVFAAGEAAGAVAGVHWLREHGLPVVAIAGALTQSPLAMREAHLATGLPVLTMDTLARPETAEELAEPASLPRASLAVATG